MKILIINGPNLNLQGKRQTDVYGQRSMADCLNAIRHRYPEVETEYFQSNHEGALIDRLQATEGESFDGIVLNAGGLSHTSVSLADAVSAISTPVIEVHISNIFAREEMRRMSLLSPVCRGVISGLGLKVYTLAVEAFVIGDGSIA